MSVPFKKQNTLLFSLCLIFICSQIALAGDDWKPVTPAELSMEKGKVDPNADAEIIFWEVRIKDSTADVKEEHYLRVKIFTERGREKYSKVDIPYVKKRVFIDDVEARVIKPDGSITEISKDDVFEKEIAKADGIKVRAKSFAVPGIEPGVILEYKYQEIARNARVGSMPLYFQHEVPVQKITYYVKPRPGRYGMRYIPLNNVEKFVKDKGGYYSTSMTNIPALKDEPYMPPKREIRKWMLIYYNYARAESPNDYWRWYAGFRSKYYKQFEPKKDMKKILPQIIGDAQTDEKKISRIFRFCRNEIKNVSYDISLTREERNDISEDVDSARDALKERRGSALDVNILFGALATTAGFETRHGYTGDRSENFFDPQIQTHTSFIHLGFIAVKVGGEWKFYDPGSRFTPEGMLPWHEEGGKVMLLGKDDVIWMEIGQAGPEKTVVKRNGKFKLHEDGTLEGKVKIEYTGHLGSSFKRANYDESPARQEERVVNRVQKTLSTAVVSNIVVRNAQDPEKPFIHEYEIKVPNYAQKIGKRMFLQPGVFEFGSKPVFSAADRTHPIYFSFPWSEKDEIEIMLPEGYKIDLSDVPKPIYDGSKIGVLNINIGIGRTTNTLYYTRDFVFGNGNRTLFPAANYQPLKGLFDAFHKADTYAISLKKEATEAN